MYSVLLALFLVSSVSASCVDGTTNVLQINDISGGNLDIHFQNVVGQTYDVNGQPACYNNKEAAVHLPGSVKLVGGVITISAANDLTSDGDAHLTLRKNSILVGTVCQDGKSKSALVPDEDCHAQVITLLGANFTQLLSTPGTYDLAKIEAAGGYNNVIQLPEIKNSFNTIAKGEWYSALNLHSNGKLVGNIEIPHNTKWFYIN